MQETNNERDSNRDLETRKTIFVFRFRLQNKKSDALIRRYRKLKETTLVRGFTLIEIMIVVLIIGILLAIAVPNFVYTREQSRKKACTSNLRKIDWAKDSYIMDKNLDRNYAPTAGELWPANGTGYLKSTPLCPGGGNYTIGTGNDDPSCSYQGGNVHTIL